MQLGIKRYNHVAPLFQLKHLEKIFRHKAFKMLLSKGKITEDLIDMLMKWRHSGFNVFCGSRTRGPALERVGSERSEEFSQGVKRPWKTWPDTLSAPLFHRRG